MDLAYRNDPASRRYLGERDGKVVAYCDIDPIGDSAILIKHTEVLPAEGGKGYGSALMKSLLEHARATGKKVIPVCPYAAGYIRKHPEYRDLVRDGFPT